MHTELCMRLKIHKTIDFRPLNSKNGVSHKHLQSVRMSSLSKLFEFAAIFRRYQWNGTPLSVRFKTKYFWKSNQKD